LEYAGPVQSTYDTIVHNSLSLLRGMSLDERASKLRDQYKTREVTAFLWRLRVIPDYCLVRICCVYCGCVE
jgi:hypothetical protein